MVRTSRTLIAKPPMFCFEQFRNFKRLAEWLPGIARVQPILLDGSGQPVEVRFHFLDKDGRNLEYSLLYAYDEPRRRVAWMPSDGANWAVRGFASFEARDQGTCEMTYGLAHGPGRNEDDHLEQQAERLSEAFRRWVEAQR